MPFEQLKAEIHSIHAEARDFYTHKDEAVLGHVHVFDPLIACPNLIQALRVGSYHDQLHRDDVIRLAQSAES